MATKVTIDRYMEQLLGRADISTSDEMIIAGMEDVVNKLELFRPDELVEMATESTAIATVPVTIHNVSPALVVTCDDIPAVRVAGLDHISNRYSLKYDNGKTTYYYLIGNKLYIYPFDTNSNIYKMQGLSYGVSNGVLTWQDKLVYPLALYCSAELLFGEFSTELQAIIAMLSQTLEMDLTAEYAKVQTRLNADDTELANSQLAKVKTYIDEYMAKVGNQSIAGQNAQTRVANANMLASLHATMWGRYLAYFGMGRTGDSK
jgi:hypothetical protein